MAADEKPSRGHLQLASEIIAGVGLFLSTSCLAMRIYTKARLLRRFWIDDVLIILAWVLSVSTQGILLYGYTHSCYGRHVSTLTETDLSRYLKTIFAASVIYIPALALAKLAILMFFYHLVHTITYAWRYLIYTVAFIISGYSIGLVFAVLFACSPLDKSWDPTIKSGSCINLHAVYLVAVITNTASDVVLILIPIPLVWRLPLRFLQRIGVICMFGIGSLTIITSIIRLATIPPFLVSNDPTYKIALIILLIFIEGNFIIICGSLPYLRHFLRYYFPRWTGRRSSSSGHDSSRTPRDKGSARKEGLSRLQNDIERAMRSATTVSDGGGRPEGEAERPSSVV